MLNQLSLESPMKYSPSEYRRNTFVRVSEKPINTFRPLPCIVLQRLGYGFKTQVTLDTGLNPVAGFESGRSGSWVQIRAHLN